MAIGDASLPYPIRNVAYHVGFVILDADGDPVAGAGGLDSEFSTDLGNFADCAAEAAEVNTTSGIYSLALSATEMNGSMVMIRVQSTTAGAKTTPIILYPRTPVTLESGTLTAGTTANATLTTAASTTDNFYNGCVLHITSGNGAGQGRVITAYTGSSRIAVVTPVFGSAPSSTSGYSIYLTELAGSQVAWVGSRIVDPTTSGTPLVHATNTVSANVVAMAANTLTASALASDAAREVATDVATVLPTATVGTASVALTANGTVTANVVAMATNTITDVALQSAGVREIATDVAVVMTSSAVQSVTNTVSANVVVMAANTLTASALASDAGAEIADAVWDEATAGHTTSGTFGERLYVHRANTAQTGAAGSITLDTGAHASNSYYNGSLIVLTSGTGGGQSRFISTYTGASKIAAVGTNWVVVPSSDTTFVIIPFAEIAGATAPTAAQVADAVWDEDRASHTTAATYGLAVDATVATVNANTLTASALASDAAREIAVDVMAVLPTGTVGTASVAVTANGTVTANVVAMATNTVTDVALQSAGVREIAVDVAAVLPTATVGTASVAVTAQGTVTANVVVMAANTLTASALAADAGTEIADALIARNIAGGTSSGRTVGEALAYNRNRVAIVTGTMTVYATDDTTALWTAAVTTAAGNPVVEVDPG